MASRNFKIFIQDILEWNPFLNLPKKPIKIDRTSHQIYGGPGPHVYESDQTFKNDDWWNQQQWWTNYKETAPFKAEVAAVEESAAEAVETAKVAAEKELEAARRRNDRSAVEQQRAILGLIERGRYYPELYSTSTRS